MAQNNHEVPEQENQAREGTQDPNRRIGPNSELAKAFEELAKGERAATALENRLSGVESRIEQLLASMEERASEQVSQHSQAEGKTTDQSASK